MKKIRFGVVGLGTMGVPHAKALAADRRNRFCLGAVCDVDRDKARSVGEELAVPYFADYERMYESGLIDAVIIATPHYWHAPQTIAAAGAGIHVLCEKPLAVTVGPARAMVSRCRKHKVAFGAMLQQRTRGIMMKMKRMVDAGRLGEVFRISMVCSNWYRSQFYYDSGRWRGTWDGEGGGILINQAPHSLDLFQWIGGMPKRVVAILNTRLHHIEVENTANVICDYGGGKTGAIYATTAEAPGVERLTVSGDKGTLVAENGRLRFAKLSTPISRHMFTCKEMWGNIRCDWKDIPSPKGPDDGHVKVIRAFARHILDGTAMVATGAEAINELELSNAIYIAGFKNKPAEIPVDAAEMERLMAKLTRERSTGRGGDIQARAARQLRRLVRRKVRKGSP